MKKLLTIALVSCTLAGFAQQTPLTNFYQQNPYALNPGYAGFNGCLEAFAGHRQQWLGFAGAPVTSYLQVHSALKKKMGLGGTVYLDRLGQQSYLKATGSFAYSVKLNEASKLRFGLAAGIIQHQFSVGGAILTDNSDPLAAASTAAMSYGADFGVVFSNEKIVAGLAVPQVYNTPTPMGGEGFNFNRHYIAHAMYNYEIRDSLSVHPALVVRMLPLKVLQVEAAVQVLYNETFFFGAGYKTGTGPHAMVGAQGLKNFTIGYSYGIPFLGTNQYSTGTHEVILGYNLCKSKGSEEPTKTRTRITF